MIYTPKSTTAVMGLSKNNDRMESIVTQTTTKPKTQYISEGNIQSFVVSFLFCSILLAALFIDSIKFIILK